MRSSSVFIGIITQLLIAIVTYQITKNYFATIVSSFAYATVPSFLLLSRYAQLENVLTPLLLLSLSILLLVNQNRKKMTPKLTLAMILVASVISGLCALTKISGWISVILGTLLLYRWKFDKNIFLLCNTGVGNRLFILHLGTVFVSEIICWFIYIPRSHTWIYRFA